MISSARTFRAAIALAALAAVATPAAASAGAPEQVSCRPVAIAAQHGGPVAPLSELAPIAHGTVLVLNANTGAKATIPFRGSHWMRAADGARYAVAGQALTRAGRPGGVYLVAAKVRDDHRVACVAPAGMDAFRFDSAGKVAGAGTSLPASGMQEVSNATTNVSGLPLINDSTQKVCTNTATHPDGARLVSHQAGTSVWCYAGSGAWLNDRNGVEFDGYSFLTATRYHHVVIYNNAVVPAAKRPATKPDGEAILNSAIAWRPYSPNFHNPPGV